MHQKELYHGRATGSTGMFIIPHSHASLKMESTGQDGYNE
jgi:hypothetical protein